MACAVSGKREIVVNLELRLVCQVAGELSERMHETSCEIWDGE
jgi:hypothetical protein